RSVLGHEGRRRLLLRLLRPAAVRQPGEVRLRHRLAELLEAGRRGERVATPYRTLVLAAHGGRLQPLRCPSRARVQGWPTADRPPLLHQFGVSEVCEPRRHREVNVRPLTTSSPLRRRCPP